MGLLDWAGENPGEAAGLAARVAAPWLQDKNAVRNTNEGYQASLKEVQRVQARGVIQELTKLPGDILKDPERLPIALHDIAKKYPKVDADQFNSLVQAWQNTKVAYMNMQNLQAQESRTAKDFAT